jgi:tight adherence protein C
MLTLVVIGAFATVFLALAAVLFSSEEKREVRVALRGLQDYHVSSNVREQEMLKSLRERVFLPAVGGLAKFSGRFTPQGYAAQVREKLILAGNPAGLDADRFLSLKVIGAVSVVFWAWFALSFMALGGFYGLIVTALMSVMSFMGPDVYVRRKIDDRQYQIAIKLPDILDLLVISVEAGLGFEQAIDRVVAAVPGPLSEEFSRMLQETRMGSSRADAMRAMDERTNVPELRSFILAMLQADTFGVSIGRILRTQADEMRVRRRQRAQEKAQKAPVKMLFPLIFCIFPSLFVVILGPAAMQIMETLI